jgi:hypothetical protein
MTIHEFSIPKEINGDQLKKELNATVLYIADNKLLISADITKTEIAEIIASHKPEPIVELTIEQKLASVGLSVGDLKAALGI